MIFSMAVTLQIHGKDRHKHTLAEVLIEDEIGVTLALAKDGWCRWDWKCAHEDAALEVLEAIAREANQGIRVDLASVSP